ncbi:MAG: lectin [Candidatus Rokubacteria bacterium]|nr:lectin [Candidatus Rokubacteria bacterium]
MKRAKRTISFLAVGAMVLVASAVSDAAPMYNPATGHWYDTVPGGLQTWAAAEAGAVAMGGHLVTINDAAEQAWLLANGWGAPFFLWWIGFNDMASEGSFVWVSGEPVTYTNWAGGEPNDFGGSEDVVVMNWSASAGLWNDLPTSWTEATGLAELPASAVPEPTTLLLWGTTAVGLAVVRRLGHRRSP